MIGAGNRQQALRPSSGQAIGNRVFGFALCAWLLALCGSALAQTGWLVRPDCGTLTPVNDATVCMQTSSAGGRTPGIYLYTGNAWQPPDKLGDQAKTVSFDVSALPAGNNTVKIPTPNPVMVRGIATPNDSLCVGYIDTNGVQVRVPCSGGSATPVVGFSNGSSSGSESITNVTIPVTLTNPPAGAVTVNYAATGGTATGGGTDYTLTSGTLTFNGTTTQNISVTVVDDGAAESTETIVITLSSPSSGVTLGTATHTYSINDNDSGGGAALVASGAAGSANAHTVDMPSLNSTGSSVGYMCTSSAGNLVVSDNKGGTWTEIDSQGPATEARLWKGTGATWGSGHVVSITENGTRYPSGVVAFFSGVTQNGTPVKNSADASSIQPGSVTPSNATNILIACLAASANTGTISASGGYTMSGQVAYADGQRLAAGMAHLVQSTATAGNPTLSWTSVVPARAIAAALVP